MLSIWFVQFPSDAKVNPKCLWFLTISTGSPLNRRSKCGTALLKKIFWFWWRKKKIIWFRVFVI
jgi:hypothetical protein